MLVLIGVWPYMKSVLFSLETFPFVLSGLNKRTTTEGLREAFAKFGEVVDGLFLFQNNLELSFVGTPME